MLSESSNGASAIVLARTNRWAWLRGMRFATLMADTVTYAILIGLGIGMVIPLVYMVDMSFTEPGREFMIPISWIPNPVWPQNYQRLFSLVPFARFAFNSVWLAVVGTFGALLSASMAAFAFARLPFRGRNVLWWLTLATLMVPGTVTLIPQFLGFRLLGWIGTYLPLVVPPFFGGGAIAIFMLRQFFMTLPQELMDAAEVDGASPPRIYWSLFLPLCKPALATMAVLTFIGRWNDLLGPLIFLRKTNMFTIPVGVAFLQQTVYSGVMSYYVYLMAASVISIIPILVVFVQKYFVQGIVTSGLKG
jgi:ABC-type glycerol-3-phosphate transport system permease component